MEMKEVRLILKSSKPVLFSRFHNEPRLEAEEPEKYEQRTWMHRVHTNADGTIIIPGFFFQKCLEEAGKMTGERVNGKKQGKSIHGYLASIRVIGDIDTGVNIKDVENVSGFVSSNGKPGGGKVMRIFPKIDTWRGVLTFQYPNLNIIGVKDIIKYLDIAGTCIGIGHWRPGSPSKGSYGTFIVKKPKVKSE